MLRGLIRGLRGNEGGARDRGMLSKGYGGALCFTHGE
jgi:hypothetical protein